MASSLYSSRKTLSSLRTNNNNNNSSQRASVSHSVVWVLLTVVVGITGSLLITALYIVQDSIDPQQQLQQKHAFLEPGHHALQQPPKQVLIDAVRKRNQQDNSNYSQSESDSIPIIELRAAISALEHQFTKRYGSYATLLREKGVTRYGSYEATAQRVLRALAEGRPMEWAFAGYSVTVGRGNYFTQSYPLVLQELLQPLYQPLQASSSSSFAPHMINSAIGGIPSFPYGFCLQHFLGEQPDVVSWDYSMNENGRDNTAVLEAYIRHVQAHYPQTQPMILALDNHPGRCQILQKYVEQGLLQDALCVKKADQLFSKAQLQTELSSSTLDGFVGWNDFGAPDKCPGRSSWHPKKQEHAMIAWMLAMDFAKVLETALTMIEENPHDWKDMAKQALSTKSIATFPAPLSSKLFDNDAAVNALLYGHNNDNDNDNHYHLHKVACRTSFLPAATTSTTDDLPSIVTHGLNQKAQADTILHERTDADYAAGWVLDVSSVERQTKIKVEKCGGLGYVDMKIALYGIPESGPLHLFLPVNDERTHADHDHEHASDQLASHWMDSLIICEANEKRSKEACQLDQDLRLVVGGATVEVDRIRWIHGAAEYLKRPTCIQVPLPATAQMTQQDDGTWGLPVHIHAAARVNRKNGACCVSHVAWEMH